MKNVKMERFGLMQRQYHRSHPWRLSQGGLYVPHSYTEVKPDSLSTWDDVGFILNKRRVIVWWEHPRRVYADALDAQSWEEAGEDPLDDWLTEGATKNYRKLGASRKQVVSYTTRQPSEEQRRYYDTLDSIRACLAATGIDLDVTPSWMRKRLSWATGISLVAPLEVRNESELASVTGLARRLMLGQSTLETEFPGYRYTRADWLREQATPPLV